MENFIKSLEIKNFKSIKNINIDLSRINLFIGKTNVGKTNILEAISLLSKNTSKNNEFYSDVINYDYIDHLFHYTDIENDISVKTDKHFAILKNMPSSNSYKFFQNLDNNSGYNNEFDNITNNNSLKQYLKSKNIINFNKYFITVLDKFKKMKEINSGISDIKLYKFKENDFSIKDNKFLNPPNGNNLYKVISLYSRLRNDLIRYLEEYNLEVVYSPKETEFKIQKKENSLIYQLPLTLLADTLQRILFYKAAIISNKNSILLFEEPEVHSYPPYIKELAENIFEDKNNQYFITTHSPYMFDTLIEDGINELSVFLVEFNNYQTIVRKLSEIDLKEILTYNYDVFFNLENIGK